jgi:carboxymethylenebutenolidase
MCYAPEALPPKPPKSGYLLSAGRTVLATPDGGMAPAFIAQTLPVPKLASDSVERLGVSDPLVYRAEPGSGTPGVVILPDQRGLHWFYEKLAEYFADAGIHAVAVDFYHRTAGTAFRGDDFDFAAHRGSVTTQSLDNDVRAGIGALRNLGVSRTYVLGFCLGGRGALLQATNPDLAGVVGFYGFPTREDAEGRSPIGDAGDGKAVVPILALFGADDESVGREAPHEYREALSRGGASHEVVVYPDAGHSFFDRRMREQEDHCADAWSRILKFVR